MAIKIPINFVASGANQLVKDIISVSKGLKTVALDKQSIDDIDQFIQGLESLGGDANDSIKLLTGSLGFLQDAYTRLSNTPVRNDGLTESVSTVAALKTETTDLLKIQNQTTKSTQQQSTAVQNTGNIFSSLIKTVQSFLGNIRSGIKTVATIAPVLSLLIDKNKQLDDATKESLKTVLNTTKAINIGLNFLQKGNPIAGLIKATGILAPNLTKLIDNNKKLDDSTKDKLRSIVQKIESINKIPFLSNIAGGAINSAISKLLGLNKAAQDANKTTQDLGDSMRTIGQSSNASKAVQDIKPPGVVGQGVAGLAFAFNNVTQSIGTLFAAAKPAYDLLIGQNEKLNQQLLGAQANLVATNKVFKDGVEVTDPTEAIKALEGPIKEAVAQIQKDSLELVGVTSKDLIGVFNILTAQASNLNNQSAQFPDSIQAATTLTKSFAASLGTLNIPLDQARQEINSILTAQISSDSVLAKNLGITSDMVQQWKSQGILVDELLKKTKAFEAGNALAAHSIGGITSNLQEILELTSRVAGEPLLEPLVNSLDGLYKFLQENQEEIQQFSSDAIIEFLGLAEVVGNAAQEIGKALLPSVKALAPAAEKSGDLLITGFKSAAEAVVILTKVISPFLEVLAQTVTITVQAIELSQTGIGYLTGSYRDSTQAAEAYGRATSLLSNEAIKNAQKLKSAVDLRNEAAEKQIRLTKEQEENERRARESAQAQIQSLKAHRTELLQTSLVGEENKNSIKAQVAETDRMIKTLENLSGKFKTSTEDVKIQAKGLEELGSTYQQLKKKAESAQKALKEGAGGDISRANEAAKQLVDLTERRRQLGQISAQQAIEQFESVKNNTKLSYEQQLAAAEAITKIKEREEQRQLASLKSQQSAVQVEIAAGEISQAQGEKQLTILKKKELETRLSNLQTALKKEKDEGRGNGDRARDLAQQEKEVQGELLKVKAEAAQKEREQRLKDFDEQKTKLDANKAERLLSEQEYNKQSLKLQISRLDEELRQIKEQRKKLSSTDKEGLEEVTAKENEIRIKRAQAIEQFQKQELERRLKVIETEQEKITDTITSAEVQRQTEIQQLLNDGVIGQEEADKRRLDSTRQRIKDELAAEKQRLSGLEQTQKLNNLQDEEKRQDDIRNARIKTAELTQQLMENEYQQQQQLDQERQRLDQERQRQIEVEQEKIIDTITSAEVQRQTEIQQLLNNGVIGQEEADKRRLDSTRQRIKDELAAEKQRLSGLEQTQKLNNLQDEEKRQDDIRNARIKTAELTQQLLENEYQQRQRLIQQYQRQIELEQEKLTDAITKSEVERELQIQQLLNKGVIFQTEADQQRLKSTQKRIREELELEQQYITASQNLPKVTGEEAEQREKTIRDAKLKTIQLTLELAQNEAQEQQRLKEQAIGAIEERSDTQVRASEKAISQLEEEKSIYDTINNAIENSNKLLQSRADLQKSVADLFLAQSESEVGKIEKAIELRRQLDQAESPEKKLAIQRALTELQFSSSETELSLLQKKQALENQIAEQKRTVLLAEQERQRQSLVLELQKNQLTAERAVIEARIAEKQAEQNLLSAQSNLLRTQQNPEDKQGIANAQAQVELARQAIKLANQRTTEAQGQVDIQKEVSKNALTGLGFNQQAELNRFDSAEQIRKVGQGMEIAEAKSAGLAKNMKEAAKDSQKLAENASKIPETTSTSRTLTFSSRREGGTINAGEPYLVGDGPGGTVIPGVSEIVVPGVNSYVLAARKVSDLINSSPLPSTRNITPASSLSGGMISKQLIGEIKGLRADIKERKPVAQNQFTFNREGSEMNQLTQVLDIIRTTMPL